LIDTHQLGPGSSLILPARTAPTSGGLSVIVGGGRGCTLSIEWPVAGLWVPLRGRLQISGAGGDSALLAGEMRITEPEPRLHVVGRGNAVWIALIGSRPAWRSALSGLGELPLSEPILLPTWHTADRPLRCRIIELARAAMRGMAEPMLQSVIESVFAVQNELASAIDRCPGRTYAQRRQVFLRLQRVRNYLTANCHLELDNEALARMASYSPWHFIRAFRAAYQQTPHAFLVDQRLQRARRLLRTSPLAIAEIALASGFENRCAFSRLFRQRFGITAGAMRRMTCISPMSPLRRLA